MVSRKERVGRLVQMHATTRMEIPKIYSGDICAIVGLKDTTTGDTAGIYSLGIEPPTVKSSKTYPLPGSPGSMCSLQ